MTLRPSVPRVVLLCHERDRLDREGLAHWLASSVDLAGIVSICEPRRRVLMVARREWRRSGILGVADAAAWRLFYRLRMEREDAEWTGHEVARLIRRYPADLSSVPVLTVESPNGAETSAFLRAVAPDLMVARCKILLRPEIFGAPRLGTYVLHPGICPEYRNAHGCFWALSRGDLARVGMTLLRVDAGVDTGAVFLQASCRFDPRRESPLRIQYRVVTHNLDAIAHKLTEIVAGEAEPIVTAGRVSAVWGQPRLTAYWRGKRAATKETHASRLAPVP